MFLNITTVQSSKLLPFHSQSLFSFTNCLCRILDSRRIKLGAMYCIPLSWVFSHLQSGTICISFFNFYDVDSFEGGGRLLLCRVSLSLGLLLINKLLLKSDYISISQFPIAIMKCLRLGSLWRKEVYLTHGFVGWKSKQHWLWYGPYQLQPSRHMASGQENMMEVETFW
jgi:hypothetical protein